MSPAAFAEEMLAPERPRDAVRNKETRPPDGESVTFRSITVAEVYVGREADSLAAALESVEWVNFDEPISDEIAVARKGDGYYRAQFMLASNPDPDLALRGYGTTSLPKGVE
jgi:hypothetical protein